MSHATDDGTLQLAYLDVYAQFLDPCTVVSRIGTTYGQPWSPVCGRWVYRIGAGLLSAVAARFVSHPQIRPACRNAERANSSAAARGSAAARTSSQSRMYSPRVLSQRAAAGDRRPCAKVGGAG